MKKALLMAAMALMMTGTTAMASPQSGAADRAFAQDPGTSYTCCGGYYGGRGRGGYGGGCWDGYRGRGHGGYCYDYEENENG